jgi:nucleoporin POM152
MTSNTPRLRSAFPNTPRTDSRPYFANSGHQRNYPTPQSSKASTPSKASPPIRQTVIRGGNHAQDTLIPLDVANAATQRLYTGAIYAALLAWRLYDGYRVTDDLDSTWLFLKWLGIDAIFLVCLPAFRIPWLEFSFATTVTIWLVQAVMNGMLMYHISIPVGVVFTSMIKVAYDRELSISEHRVKPADIIHNSSIILGKQIIQILPEGSAVLNPEKIAFCLDEKTTSINLPIRINQTVPILIELLRYDLATSASETITINAKQARQLRRQADKEYHKSDKTSPRTLLYSTSKTGLYQLQRVVDESKLEVRKRNTDTLVVTCPRASISAAKEHKCTGDLSDVSLNVTGVAPFKVKYSKRINKQQASSNVQSIQPPDFESPLSPEQVSQTIIDPQKLNLDWAKPTSVSVAINELLNLNGTWSYSVEEVEDGCGNKVGYPSGISTGRNTFPQQQSVAVHHRPRVFLSGCDAQTFLKVAKGESVSLPVRLRDPSQLSSDDWPLKLRYTFTPDVDSGIPAIESYEFAFTNEHSLPRIHKAGKYSIESVDSTHCAGEVTEPSLCLLFNPPQPDLAIQADDIFDKCAGNPIGLIVNLDLTGTPPFKVKYSVSHHGYLEYQNVELKGLRGQVELKPRAAGSYTYQFLEVQDKVYGKVSLGDRKLILDQDVRPPASATFADGSGPIKSCLDQAAVLNVKLVGEGPWDLEYELVHGGKRKKFSVRSENDLYTIATPPLSEGGEHSIVLTSVQDKSKCKTSIREERHIDVRPEQPRASFGDIEGRRYILALEGKAIKLPLRLKGVAPWNVEIANLGTPSAAAVKHTLWDANAAIPVDHSGIYEIVSVHDTCPGVVDPNANTFEVAWISRPTLAIKDPTLQADGKNAYRKPAVCVGDESAVAVAFSGNPPYQVKYQQKSELLRGPAAVSNKQISAAIGSASVHMDTSKAGDYTYTFGELSDDRYAHDRKRFQPLVVRQQVYALPSARFSHPGTTYRYCKNEEGGEQNIPITLGGSPPFSVEIGMMPHGNSKPDIVRLRDILSNSFSWNMARRGLGLGTHSISIRKVKDSRGCEQIIEDDPSAVRVMVSDPPTIIPLESQTDYCVGDHVSYSLSGQPPFDVFYRFQGRERKARATTTTFRRIAEQAGEFTITALSDNASGKCKAEKNITKIIHPMPTVKISKGKTSVVDIHEGGDVEILFEFTGTPPFEFTYVQDAAFESARMLTTI